MEFFIKELMDKGLTEIGHRHFLRFGKGDYKRRFLMKINKGKNLKIQTSFELANDLVNFVRDVKDVKFSGKVFTRTPVSGMDGKKKAGSYVYDVVDSDLKEFDDVYFYLVDVAEEEINLKIKKAIPKPGKSEEKIDDKFCTLVLDLKFLDKVMSKFFWDVPSSKKAIIEHEIIVNEIILPDGVKDPAKMRELAKRKGKIIRKIVSDGNEVLNEKIFTA